MADRLHELRAAAGAERLDRGIARVAIRFAELDLDELVVLERAVELVQHGRRDATLADADDRVQSVREPAQIAFL